MHPNPRKVAPILIVLLLAALAYWYFAVRPAQADNGVLSATGTIEATQIRLSPELGGKVLEVLVAEGDAVKSGDVLLRFDTALLAAQRAQAAAMVEVAQANADAAEANVTASQAQRDAAQGAQTAAEAAQAAAQSSLELLEAGATAEQLATAQAQVDLAEANRQAAQASYDALTAGARPEDVSAARSRLDWARQEYYSMTVALSAEQLADVAEAVSQAETNLSLAQERLARLEKDTTAPASALLAAQQSLADCQAALEAAQAANTLAQEANQPFYLQIAGLRASWELSLLQLDQAQARQDLLDADADIPDTFVDTATDAQDEAQDMVDAARSAYDALDTSDQADQLRAAWNGILQAQQTLNAMGRRGGTPVETVLDQLDAASAQQAAAQSNLANLESGARPEQISAAQAQRDAAAAQVDTAGANLTAAEARLEAANAQFSAAQAQVEAAQAAVEVLDVQLGKLTITAPADGVILMRSIEPGEAAAPGATLFTLGQLERLTITVYIPEDRYGAISLGQTASVKVDSFSGTTFTATVTYIADKAEFTPRNVQTADGRRTTVFAVKLTIDNADGRLKPGMPADVTFGK